MPVKVSRYATVLLHNSASSCSSQLVSCPALQVYTPELAERARRLVSEALTAQRLLLPSYECSFPYHQLYHISEELPAWSYSLWGNERMVRFLLAIGHNKAKIVGSIGKNMSIYIGGLMAVAKTPEDVLACSTILGGHDLSRPYDSWLAPSDATQTSTTREQLQPADCASSSASCLVYVIGGGAYYMSHH